MRYVFMRHTLMLAFLLASCATMKALLPTDNFGELLFYQKVKDLPYKPSIT
jgi:hypothetical protein